MPATMFGLLLVLQLGAALVRLDAGYATPGALLAGTARLALGVSTLRRPGSVPTVLTTTPGTGLGLPAALLFRTSPVLFVAWLRSLFLLFAAGRLCALWLLARRRQALTARGGPPSPASPIPGTLTLLRVLPRRDRVVSFCCRVIAVVVFQKGCLPPPKPAPCLPTTPSMRRHRGEALRKGHPWVTRRFRGISLD
ncbi:MAG: hypothetical protein AVDCRST_MAG87-2346 [uncultured Thermomicrobiales bacterium]|uniref:Uncharacterized protein n=1 Tax=uncultured Thermomicrobiales bacterium TaxID=1645740 RepID=A0A6J4V5U1_9BACT|nr:MAG: hypothetical protein AVDCRST_MAG87-2346 [uncultured Thermomicrobiales bacterium]